MEKICKNCKWWQEKNETYGKEKIGSCHKLPPMPHPNNSIGMFSRIVAGSWCGDWEAANES